MRGTVAHSYDFRASCNSLNRGASRALISSVIVSLTLSTGPTWGGDMLNDVNLTRVVATPVTARRPSVAVTVQVVDRVSLTQFAVLPEPPGEPHDRPVEFVRVLLPARERVAHTIDGWPAWFTRRVGRGKVVFSTLGFAGLYLLLSVLFVFQVLKEITRGPVAAR